MIRHLAQLGRAQMPSVLRVRADFTSFYVGLEDQHNNITWQETIQWICNHQIGRVLVADLWTFRAQL